MADAEGRTREAELEGGRALVRRASHPLCRAGVCRVVQCLVFKGEREKREEESERLVADAEARALEAELAGGWALEIISSISQLYT